MTFSEWYDANFSNQYNQFQNVQHWLRTLGFESDKWTITTYRTLLALTNHRYGLRTILAPPVTFEYMYLGKVANYVPTLVREAEKYALRADFINKQNFGDTTTSESSANNTNTSNTSSTNNSTDTSKTTNTSSDTSRNTSDGTERGETTNQSTDTSKVTGTNSSTNNSNGANSSTNINLEGVVPDLVGTNDLLNTSIQGYGKGVTKTDGTTSDQTTTSGNSSNTTNTTNNSSSNNNVTKNSTSNTTNSSESSSSVNNTGNSTNTSNTTSNGSNTNTSNSKRVNIQESIKMILDSDGQWGLGLEEFLASIEDLFVGATYYVYR